MQAAGEAVGLAPAVAADLARQTLIGAARQLEGDARSPAQLRQAVTSKGGMTEAALQTLAQRQWPEAMTHAVQAAVQRADALAGR
jgi:pyrroline-5-carboxylate reductase